MKTTKKELTVLKLLFSWLISEYKNQWGKFVFNDFEDWTEKGQMKIIKVTFNYLKSERKLFLKGFKKWTKKGKWTKNIFEPF